MQVMPSDVNQSDVTRASVSAKFTDFLNILKSDKITYSQMSSLTASLKDFSKIRYIANELDQPQIDTFNEFMLQLNAKPELQDFAQSLLELQTHLKNRNPLARWPDTPQKNVQLEEEQAKSLQEKTQKEFSEFLDTLKSQNLTQSEVQKTVAHFSAIPNGSHNLTHNQLTEFDKFISQLEKRPDLQEGLKKSLLALQEHFYKDNLTWSFKEVEMRRKWEEQRQMEVNKQVPSQAKPQAPLPVAQVQKDHDDRLGHLQV